MQPVGDFLQQLNLQYIRFIIYLRKHLIAMYTASFKESLEVRMLPFVLALDITVQGGISRNEDLASLVTRIAKITQYIPSLRQLYPAISIQNISPEVKRYLNKYIRDISSNQNLSNLEEKRILSKNSQVSFIQSQTRASAMGSAPLPSTSQSSQENILILL